MKEKQSVIVLIFGWLFILSGVYGFINILIITFFLPLEAYKDTSRDLSPYGPLIDIGTIFIGINLLRYKNWARIITVFSCGVSLIFVLYKFFTTPISSQTLGLFMLINISFILLFSVGFYFFTRPEVKEQFK